jgi:hypothetical protein
MHRVDGVNEYTLDGRGFYSAKGAPLGADDGAGIAILSVLMRSVPAYYVFCRGEERGGVGSKYIAEHFPELLGAFDRAIAFDRRGYSDVITHQFGGRCCSDAFAEALSDSLNDQGLLYMPCDGGVYTDTAEFTDFIPECTNISVGYDHEHSDREVLDGEYLKQLCAAALKVDWDSLPVDRELGDDYDLLNISGFPPTVTADEHDIAEAVYAALEGAPDELMAFVAAEARVPKMRLDLDLFGAGELMAICGESFVWQDVIDTLATEAVPWTN